MRIGPWTLNAGLRWDRYRLAVSDSALSPRFAAAWSWPAADLVVRASYDRAFQTPAIENLLIASSEAVETLGSEVLRLPVPPSRGDFYEAGISKAIGGPRAARRRAFHAANDGRGRRRSSAQYGRQLSDCLPSCRDQRRGDQTRPAPMEEHLRIARLLPPAWDRRAADDRRAVSRRRGPCAARVDGSLSRDPGSAAHHPRTRQLPILIVGLDRVRRIVRQRPAVRGLRGHARGSGRAVRPARRRSRELRHGARPSVSVVRCVGRRRPVEVGKACGQVAGGGSQSDQPARCHQLRRPVFRERPSRLRGVLRFAAGGFS